MCASIIIILAVRAPQHINMDAPGIGDSSTEAASRVWSLGRTRWNVFDGAEFETAERGLLLVRTGSHGSAWALGSAELWEGRHSFLFEIVASYKSSGNMHIGIADGSALAARTPGAPAAGGGAALSFHPWDGGLHSWEDWTVGYASQEERSAMPGDLDGSATGAVVLMGIDMDQRRLMISVNGGEAVDAGVTLPESVRPFVRLYHEGDAIRLAQWRQEAPSAPPPDNVLLGSDILPHIPRVVAPRLATPSGLIDAAQQCVDATRSSFRSTAGPAECVAVESALVTLQATIAAARAGVDTARARLAAAPKSYDMMEERARIEVAIAARAAEKPAEAPVLPMVSSTAAAAVNSVLKQTTSMADAMTDID